MMIVILMVVLSAISIQCTSINNSYYQIILYIGKCTNYPMIEFTLWWIGSAAWELNWFWKFQFVINEISMIIFLIKMLICFFRIKMLQHVAYKINFEIKSAKITSFLRVTTFFEQNYLKILTKTNRFSLNNKKHLLNHPVISTHIKELN